MSERFSPIVEIVKAGKAIGVVDSHSHMLTECTLTKEQFQKIGAMLLPDKWKEADRARIMAVEDFSERIAGSILQRLSRGITAARSYIDIDPSIGLGAIDKAIRAKEKYDGLFHLQIAVYPALGRDVPGMEELLKKACAIPEVEVIGCLPSRGRKGMQNQAQRAENIEYYFEVAELYGKAIDMQLDQANHPNEIDTCLFVDAASEARARGYSLPIAATHCLSMSAWENEKQIDLVLSEMVKLGISMIVCPRATLNNRQDRKIFSPTHNSIAPWDRAVGCGVNVSMGIDNVNDLYMPYGDFDIWKDVDTLINTVRWQGSPDIIVDILTNNGRKTLGLQ